MQIICPHCRLTLVIPDIFRRYYGQPIQCQSCQRAFSVPRLTASHPQRGASTTIPKASDGGAMQSPFDRSISGRLTHHVMRCTSCRSRILVPGPDQHRQSLALTCPVCATAVRYQGRTGHIGAGGLMTALTVGVGLGIIILMLDREGHIALEKMAVVEWMSQAGTMLQGWIAQITRTLSDLNSMMIK